MIPSITQSGAFLNHDSLFAFIVAFILCIMMYITIFRELKGSLLSPSRLMEVN